MSLGEGSLAEELRAAPAEAAAIDRVFARHAEPSDGWPSHRADVRRLAHRLQREGEPVRAGLILLGQLVDLRRFFETADDDSDGGWHRHEAKRWETWATIQALGRAVAAVEEPAPRSMLRRSLGALAAGDLPDWPADQIAAIAGDGVGRTTIGLDDDLMDWVAASCAALEPLVAQGAHEAVTKEALRGLEIATRLEAPNDDMAFSDERDAVLAEMVGELDAAMQLAVAQGGRRFVPPFAMR